MLLGGCLAIPSHPSVDVAGQGPPALEACTVTLVSWNTHKETGPAFDAELRRHAVGADMVLLQESVSDRSPAGTPPVWSRVVAFVRSRDGRTAGVGTASRAVPIRARGVWAPDREPVVRTPKAAVLTEVAITGDEAVVLVLNLHAINFRPAAALERQLAALERSVRDHPGPVVVAGDFNTWSARRRGIVERFAARLGLVPAFTGVDRPRLDQVFVRDLRIRSAQRLRSRASDHDPLRVVLDVCPEGPSSIRPGPSASGSR
jgi:endonuclease/exonuclease/phosphatase (EEP) superfamily protein YafD